ncbi:TonB-dependent receptor [Hoeflea sp.]|uniref:TonB-dependent receptor n=1 Tax=Hoeflea sp. TaxID=1940281 RepID=UPI0019C2D001|nr:TonB-dependent receptor [Hoeflea sp.]MBC7284565.1 TonB-dependent receptor [Hoeflea sp.]
MFLPSKRAFHAALASTVAAAAMMATDAAHAQDVAPEDDAIVVTGQRAQQIGAIEAKREALGIIDAVSSDEMGRLPDRNVAELVSRLPGVGVQYDQGEGRYIAVRGVPSGLNGYTFNGFEIGNPDGDTRALPLDVISGQLLNRIEVLKVKTPDLLAQGIGGTINLVPQTAFDFTDPFVFVATVQAGYQELREDDHPIRGDASVGGRFGADEQFGILVGATWSDRTYTSYGLYPDDWFEVEAAARGAMPTNIKYTDYRLSRERLGFAGSLDWRGGATSLYLRGLYSKFTEDEYRQRFRLDFAESDLVESGDVVFDEGGLTGSSTDTEQRSDLRLEYKEKSILTGMVGGQTVLDLWTFDYGVALTHNEVIEPNEVWQFRGDPGPVAFDFTNKLYTAVPVNGFLEPADLGFRSYSVQDQTGDEDIWQARFDLTREFGREGSFFKIGANVRSTDKSFDDESVSYERGGSANRFSLDGLAGENVTVTPGEGRRYLVAPTIDEDLMQNFTGENLGTARFVLDEESTLADQVLSDFDITEDVYAAYAMAAVDFGMLNLLGGLRVERTELEATGFRLENETDVVPANDEGGYTDWLPSAIARIEPAENVLVRLAYSRSVGRPAYEDLSPGGELFYEAIGEGLYEGGLALGNSNLRPYRSDNLDLSIEWYFARGGLVSVAGFAKWIDDPIFTRSFTQTDISYGGRNYEIFEFSQPENASSGEIKGLELAWQQQFLFLPGLLSGLGVNANLTVVDSELKVPDRETRPFPEQSDLLWGVQLFYQKGPLEASVAYDHTGKALIGVADDPIEDQFNDDLRRLDAKLAFDINQNFRVFVQGQNLTDEPTRQYQGGVSNWVLQHERYGRTFWLGATTRW